MKIKAKENIDFLESKYYDIIAIDAMAFEFYLIQLDSNEFCWIESQYFDKQTIERNDSLIEEKNNRSGHQKVPFFMLKKERKIGKDKYWQINSNEFCDFVSLHLALSNHGFSINPEIQEIINNESTQFRIIEQQINQVGKTLILLGNGYFPSIVSIHRISKNSPKQNIRQEFRLDFHYMRNDQNVEESNVITLDNTLDELFDWSYNYVKVFSKYPKMFEDSYWNDQIIEMINTCKKNLLVYNQLNTLKAKRYFLPQSDGSEVNLLQFESEHSKTTLRIQNIVH